MMQLTCEPREYRELLEELTEAPIKPERKSALIDSIDIACQQAASYDGLAPSDRALSTNLSEPAKQVFLHLWTSRPQAVDDLRTRVFSWLPGDHRGRCPYCALECQPGTLDHFLEQSIVPELALYDRNLIPCCAKCNSDRPRTFGPNGQSVLHFYDDRIGELPHVLRAELENKEGIMTARFFLAEPLPPAARTYARHFQSLSLARRYRVWAATVLPIELGLIRNLSRDPIRSQEGLRAQAEQLRQNLGPNEPRVALYDAIANAPEVLVAP